MKILVSSAFRDHAADRPHWPAFTPNVQPDSIIRYDSERQPVTFRVDASGTTAERSGSPVSIPPRIAMIRSSEQLRLMLEAHDLVPAASAGIEFEIAPFHVPGSFIGAQERAPICSGAGCGAVGCAAVGCAAAGGGGSGCGAAGCAAVGCAAAGCGAVGCAAVTCAAAGKGGGGCAAAGCGAVGCAAAGCAAAACGAVICAAAGCATVACGAATGACGAAACALDSLCGANAGWPP